jgi:hypothetical protein
MAKLHHNKKRNTGLVYEFLIRKISSSMIEKDESSQKEAIGILKRFFGPGRPLAEELSVFSQIVPSRGLTERTAGNLLEESREFVRSLDRSAMDREKGRLIKEINRSFGKGFFDMFRIDDYRVFATLGMLVEKWSRGALQESRDRARLEEVLIGHMMSRSEEIEDLPSDRLVYSIALRKLDEKYGSSLSHGQKKILKEYVACSLSEDRDFASFASAERDRILRTVEVFGATAKKDRLMLERIESAKKRLGSLDMSPSDDLVEELMLFAKLEEEIGSDG